MPGADDTHQLLRTLEDTPFYARSLIAADVGGERGTGLHESLCMRRFSKGWVQTLLPFRMPRLA
jgi:carotenoid 1,2-hydratase